MTLPEPRLPRLGALTSGMSTADLVAADDWLELLVEADLEAADLQRLEARGCRVVRSHLLSVRAEETRWVDAEFDECELAGARMSEAAFTRVLFRGGRLSGAQLFASRLNDVRFESCRADGASFRFTKGERVAFIDCDLRGAEFVGAELASVRFEGCDLEGADFTQARIADAHLHRSQLQGIRGATGLQRPVIEASQVVPFALSLFAVHGVVVEAVEDEG